MVLGMETRTLEEIDLEISQVREEIAMTECSENRAMLESELQDLITERASTL